MNERRVLRAIQTRGPLSRAEVARYSGISAPTASKAVESLLRAGFLEEGEAPEFARGRPAKKLHLPTRTAQVLGLVIDAEECWIGAAGLDGALAEEQSCTFPTPPTYELLIETAAARAGCLLQRAGVTTLGLGISVPGLIDYRRQVGILSPNVPVTNGRSPVKDFARSLGLPCVMLQESHALCLAERHYGAAQGLDDFAMLDVHIGVGLGIMSGGRLLTGHRGLAGEIGHITVAADGRPCGCGNLGCLETAASDSAVAWEISQQLGQKIAIDEAVRLIRSGEIDAKPALEKTARYLGIGLAAVINLFNPATLFVHGRMIAADTDFFAHVLSEAEKRALPPSFADCRIVLARGSKRQGAITGIIDQLMNSLVPATLKENHTRMVRPAEPV